MFFNIPDTFLINLAVLWIILNLFLNRKYRPEIEKFIAMLMERDAHDSEVIPNLKLKVGNPV